MPFSVGDRLGPYEILAPIGAGGMGEVYRARDTKLDREVAIKVLPAAFAQDPERLARFEREAKVLAALNHPNIAQIYGLEQRALVMELVEGETLKGPLPVETALNYAKQIADALEAAHEKGITHRDLKPANIMITPAGVVKVLDFGLAAVAQDPASGSTDPSNSPTLTMRATQAGMIMGTAAYMSPEQAAGKPVDKRADIWSFGVVLFELLTGRQLFGEGETIAHTLADVLRASIDFDRLSKETPRTIRDLLRRCLDRDVKNRLRDIGEARVAIQKCLADPLDETESPQQRTTARPAWAIAAVVLAALAAALAFVHLREKPPEARVLRTSVLPPENTTFDFANGLGLLALSPDGRRMVFGARTADGKNPLWVRSMDGLAAQPLAGTEGGEFPFWSPDSRFVAFFADGKLKKIDASGGPAITLADALSCRGGSWSPEGIIIFAPGGGQSSIRRVPSAGGASSSVFAEPARFPWFLPDGRHFLYQGVRSEGDATIRVGSLDGSPSKLLADASSNALYAQGHLLFLREGTLMAQPFDTARLATSGEAVPVAEQVQSVLGTGTAGVFSVSATGLLAYGGGGGRGGWVLTWFDRSGKQGRTLGDAVTLGAFQFSPDRKSVAAGIIDRGNGDIWIYDVTRGLRTRFTFDAASDANPIWSPDGRSIAFRSNRKGHYDLYRKAANGAGAEELLYADDLDKIPTSWSPDGKFLLYHAGEPKTKAGLDLWALPLAPERLGGAIKPVPVVHTAFAEFDGQFSPDGRWIVYESNESQRQEIYVTPFPPPSSGPGGKRQISTAGGAAPRWRQDGKEIFFVGPDRRLMAAGVAAKGDTLEVGEVRALFGPIVVTTGIDPYDVSGDGQGFLVRTSPEQKSAEPLTLVENWAAELKK